MVLATKGSLLECDAPLKQFLLSLNEGRPASDRFVIEDLDDTHLLVQADQVEDLRQEIERFLDANHYTAPTELS